MKTTTTLALGLALAGLVAAGCKKKEAPATTGGGAVAGKTTSPAAPPKPVRLTPEQRKQFLAHLKAGRKHENAKEWAPAVTEFEAALAVAPGDARASSELGWAAFQAGDYAKAKKANVDALAGATDAKQKGAVLYNMGRVAEAQNDAKAAANLYQQSVAVRPNKAVSERLAKLGQAAAPPTKEALPCAAPEPLADVCGCLAKQPPDKVFESGFASDDDKPECEAVDSAKVQGAQLVRVYLPDHSMYYLAADTGQGWSVIERVGEAIELGRNNDELEVKSFVDKKVGDGRVLWLEYEDHHSYMGGGTEEEDKEHVVRLCVLAPGAPRCVVRAPLEHTTHSTTWDDETGDEKDGAAGSSKYKVDLNPDGTANIVQVENKGDGDYHPPLGTQKLW
jgi:tetratricopeptide (TPR) repeat protein